ncbi:hypothetical protein [Paraburkholderia sp. EG304]|uniref:hypothetical protein n=1 Tax=Paraburkholderia sp. EG304 TaxID=3237015 RepID=UPI0039784A71
MSSRSRKARAKLAPATPEPPPSRIDAWVPDYGRECEACGSTPCVSGLSDGHVVYAGALCGVCTWGEAACSDPANW